MRTRKDSAVYDVAIYCRLSKEDEKEDGARDESTSIGTHDAGGRAFPREGPPPFRGKFPLAIFL